MPLKAAWSIALLQQNKKAIPKAIHGKQRCAGLDCVGRSVNNGRQKG
ncbi:MAG: hypothetical protein IKC47_04065 [Clostridia bacterium]|nr:hypothetical protein [Clostridia bacterium]